MSSTYPDRLILALRSQLDGLEEDLAAFAIMEAWHELCRRSNCWQERHSITIANPMDEYVPIAPSYGRTDINYVLWVDINGWPVYAWLYDKPLDTDYRDRVVDFGDTKAIRTTSLPAGTLNYAISLRPNLSRFVSDQPRAWILREMQDTYHEHILHGTLALLCDMPTKPWYNPAKAQDSRRRFLALVTNAMSKVRRRNAFGADLPPRFNTTGMSRRPFRG